MSDTFKLDEDKKRMGELLNYAFWKINELVVGMKAGSDDEIEKLLTSDDAGVTPGEKEFTWTHVLAELLELMQALWDFNGKDFDTDKSLELQKSIYARLKAMEETE